MLSKMPDYKDDLSRIGQPISTRSGQMVNKLQTYLFKT